MKSMLDTMLDMGYDPPQLIDDGRIHRFAAPDKKRSNRSAWYVYHGTHGAFGSWVTGEEVPWSDRMRGDPMRPKEEAKRVLRQSADRFDQIKRDRAEALIKVDSMMSRAKFMKASDHPYVALKKLQIGTVLTLHGMILVPLINCKGKTISIQMIMPDGEKRFIRNSEVRGGYSVIGDYPSKGMYICEGWATGCTIFEMTGRPVVCAFNSGNLDVIACMWRRLHPTIAADNDSETMIRGRPFNPGMEAGMAVAEKYGLDLVIPVSVVAPVTDFNDLYCWAGAKECRRQLKMKVTL